MRNQLYLFFLFFIFYCVPTFAQKSNSARISQAKISIKIQPTPRYKIKNIPTNNFLKQNWLALELEYVPLKTGKNNILAFNFNDSFNIKFEALVPTSKNNEMFLLSTTVRYWPISFNRKKHYALALIPLNIMHKITPLNIDNEFLEENLKLKATFYLNKTKIGQAYYPPSKATEKLFTAINSSAMKITRLPGAIFNRYQTPWSLINFNKYELIKQQN